VIDGAKGGAGFGSTGDGVIRRLEATVGAPDASGASGLRIINELMRQAIKVFAN